jgi:hypothetical protein
MDMKSIYEGFPGDGEDEEYGSGIFELSPEELEQSATDVVGDSPYIDIGAEETSGDILRGIVDETRSKLHAFGVKGALSARHEEIVDLWHSMDMSSFLLDDLVFFTLDHKQRTLRNSFTKVSFTDISERSTTVSDNPYAIRTRIAEDVVPELVKLGFNKVEAYRWATQGPEERTQVVRRLGWLLRQPYMEAFPQVVKSEEAAHDTPLNVPKILALATQEVSRQLKIHSSKEQKARFNNRISYERERYDEVKESIENALNMCEITFHGKKI